MMTKTFALMAASALTLSACMTGALTPAPTVDPLADTAMAVTRNSIAGTTLPNGVTIDGPIATALAECIAEHATFEELTVISSNVDQAVTDTTISAVLARPDTIGCATTALT